MRFWPMATLLLLAACSPDSISPTTTPTTEPGALGNGGFSYTCLANDATCTEGDQIVPRPLIAVGAEFSLAYQANSGSQGFYVVPASSSLVSAPLYEAGNFQILAAGDCAYLAENNGNIEDFLNILGAPVDHLDVPTALSVAPSAQVSATVAPMTATENPLAGALEYMWSSSDETIASVAGRGPTASITGIKPGQVIITVGTGGVFNTFSVTVMGA